MMDCILCLHHRYGTGDQTGYQSCVFSELRIDTERPARIFATHPETGATIANLRTLQVWNEDLQHPILKAVWVRDDAVLSCGKPRSNQEPCQPKELTPEESAKRQRHDDLRRLRAIDRVRVLDGQCEVCGAPIPGKATRPSRPAPRRCMSHRNARVAA
jgi:hypothetical protein